MISFKHELSALQQNNSQEFNQSKLAEEMSEFVTAHLQDKNKEKYNSRNALLTELGQVILRIDGFMNGLEEEELSIVEAAYVHKYNQLVKWKTKYKNL